MGDEGVDVEGGEIVEGAPYDPSARERLGDLLLAYEWFDEAYAQYVTLRTLRPGEASVEVRVALAALDVGRGGRHLDPGAVDLVRWSVSAAYAGLRATASGGTR